MMASSSPPFLPPHDYQDQLLKGIPEMNYENQTYLEVEEQFYKKLDEDIN